VSPFRLRTFGTLGLSGSDDESLLGKHAQQKRRLALLAVLAAAGEKGRSRDQLLLLFWPDAAQARARHSLEQLLYALRSSIHEDVFSGGNPVRLNETVIASDVAAFNEAIARKDFATAAGLYDGPFLEGFYLNDSPEFEQWQASERGRLERTYTSALERLVETSHDSRAALTWWQKLVDTDPLSSRYAGGYMRALVASGDHAGALQFGERYQSLVTRELGTGSGPDITNLVAEIRAQSKAEKLRPPRSEIPVQPREQAVSDPAPSSLPSRPAQPARQAPPVQRRESRGKHYIAGAVVVSAAIAVASWLITDRKPASPQGAAPSSIAVLPFANVSGNESDVPIVDGLTEEMIAILGKIPNLSVVSRTSVFAFRNTTLDVRQIADSLNVANLLEGSVQKTDSTLRVRIRLVDGRTGSTRWSETYDRGVRNMFSVQSEIAAAVARELDMRLGATALSKLRTRGTRNIAAYEAYLRGSDPSLTRSDSAANVGAQYFRQAIALDPNYAGAYAGLARSLLRAGSSTQSRSEWAATLVRARTAAEKAITLDDSLGDAHAAMSFIHRNWYRSAETEAELRKAIALEPSNSRFYEWLTQILLWTGKSDEALAAGQRAIELDPLSPTANAEYASALIDNGRCDEALARIERLKSLRPPLLRVGTISARCFVKQGEWQKAMNELRRANPSADRDPLMGYLQGRSGNCDAAGRMLATLVDRYNKTGRGAFHVAMLHAGLRRPDETFAWLNKAVEDHSLRIDLVGIVVDGFEDDARYRQLRDRLGVQ
jgi:TolB-like protein/DNA-binding SARP family transcriptional activator